MGSRMGPACWMAVSASLLIAGCVDGGSPQTDPGAMEGSPAFRAPGPLTAHAGIAVSLPGHRISEFMVAADPLNPLRLVATAVDYDDPDGPAGCATFYSGDGGHSWNRGAKVPRQTPQRLRLDPWVTFDTRGDVHLVCMEGVKPIVDHPNAALWHSRSPDGGRTWSPAAWIPARTPRHTVDKESIYAARDGALYVCVVNADSDEVTRTYDINLVAIRSKDQGASWLPPVLVKEGLFVCNGMMESAAGAVIINWFSLGNSSYPVGTARSMDGGETWALSHVADVALPPDFQPHGRFVGAYPGFSAPTAALSPVTDTILLAAQAWNAPQNGWEIKLFRSHDLGATYEALGQPPPVRDACPQCHVTHPAIAFDAQGRLGLEVQFATTLGLVKEVWFFVSDDEGTAWRQPIRLSRTTEQQSYLLPSTWTPGAAGVENFARGVVANPMDAPMMAHSWALGAVTGSVHHRWAGDYWGIAAVPGGFSALWVDHSQNGIPQLWSSVVSVPP